MSPPKVLSIGDIMVDVVALLPGPLAPGSDTPAPISFSQGGSAANTATWLARQGVRSAFLGRVGDDQFGSEAVTQLREGGVETHIGVDATAPTGLCLVLVDTEGERTMVPSAGANDRLKPDHLTPELIDSIDHLHLSAYTLLREGSRPAGRYALQAAEAAGKSLSVDASSSDPLRLIGGDEFMQWLPRNALLLANEDEALVLTGAASVSEATRRLAARFRRVVVKRGSAGVVCADRTELFEVATSPMAVRDSTGAGDAFAAGLLTGLARGLSLAEAAAVGNQLAGTAVGKVGARPPS